MKKAERVQITGVRETEVAKVDVYIAKTPRQWWLAHGMSEYLNRPAVLVISEGFKGASVLKEISVSQQSSPFLKIVLIPGKLSGLHRSWLLAKLFKRFEWWRIRSRLNSLLSEFRIHQVFTANLASVPVQYLHICLNSTNKVPFHVLDDGLETYQRKKLKPKSGFSLVYSSLMHGFKIKLPPPEAIFPFYTDGWFFNPARVHQRFKHLKMHVIQPEWFVTPRVVKLAEQALQTFGMDMLAWQAPKVVFVFSRSTFLLDECVAFKIDSFQNTIERFLNEKKLLNRNIWIKYHPREIKDDVFQLTTRLGSVHQVPTTIPFEILSASLLPGDFVVGETSTALFDVAINRPDIQVWSLGCIDATSETYRLFESAGIGFFNKN